MWWCFWCCCTYSIWLDSYLVFHSKVESTDASVYFLALSWYHCLKSESPRTSFCSRNRASSQWTEPAGRSSEAWNTARGPKWLHLRYLFFNGGTSGPQNTRRGLTQWYQLIMGWCRSGIERDWRLGTERDWERDAVWGSGPEWEDRCCHLWCCGSS